jgi:DNA polymerase III delta subunit
MNTHRVWKKRESLVKQHLQTKSDYTTLLQKLLKLEQVIKGAKEGNFWDEVENFILGITPC